MISCRLTSRNQRPSNPKSPSQPQPAARPCRRTGSRVAFSVGSINRETRMKRAQETNRRRASRGGRRAFLKQIVAGIAVGASGFPAIAQDRPEPIAAAAGNDQTSLAETLARYAAGLKYQDLPDDVVR